MHESSHASSVQSCSILTDRATEGYVFVLVR